MYVPTLFKKNKKKKKKKKKLIIIPTVHRTYSKDYQDFSYNQFVVKVVHH